MKPVSTTTHARQLIAHGTLMVAAGFMAYRYAGNPHWIHVAIFGIASGSAALLSTASLAVLSRFDKIVTDVIQHNDQVRVRGISRYVANARAEVVLFLRLSTVAALAAGAMALSVGAGHPSTEDFAWMCAIGYASTTLVGLYALRIGPLYLQLDTFQLELFERLAEEKRRVEAIRKLGGSDSLAVSTGPQRLQH